MCPPQVIPTSEIVPQNRLPLGKSTEKHEAQMVSLYNVVLKQFVGAPLRT